MTLLVGGQDDVKDLLAYLLSTGLSDEQRSVLFRRKETVRIKGLRKISRPIKQEEVFTNLLFFPFSENGHTGEGHWREDFPV